MSKISVTTIAGLTSGGDANTVKIESGDAFNVVSGTTTLGGDLAVDTNVLKVDSSNNKVGINTTSPSNDLHISSTNPVIRLQDTSTNAYAQIFTNDAGSMRLRADAGNSQSGSNFILEIDGTQQLQVDSSGRMNTYNQPSFRVGNNNSNWVNVTSGNTAIIEFDGNVHHNVGSHYSTANDRFTAPIAGRYLIGFHAYVRNNAAQSDGTSAYGYVRLFKNGGQLSSLNHIFGYGNHTDNDIQMSLQTVIELAANDYLQVALTGIGGTVQHYGSASEFYGHLLS